MSGWDTLRAGSRICCKCSDYNWPLFDIKDLYSPVLEGLFNKFKMRTFTFVLLSLAAVYSDNVANAYATIHPELSKYYHERDLGTMLPHVFAITDGACLSDLTWG